MALYKSIFGPFSEEEQGEQKIASQLKRSALPLWTFPKAPYPEVQVEVEHNTDSDIMEVAPSAHPMWPLSQPHTLHLPARSDPRIGHPKVYALVKYATFTPESAPYNITYTIYEDPRIPLVANPTDPITVYSFHITHDPTIKPVNEMYSTSKTEVISWAIQEVDHVSNAIKTGACKWRILKKQCGPTYPINAKDKESGITKHWSSLMVVDTYVEPVIVKSFTERLLEARTSGMANKNLTKKEDNKPKPQVISYFWSDVVEVPQLDLAEEFTRKSGWEHTHRAWRNWDNWMEPHRDEEWEVNGELERYWPRTYNRMVWQRQI